MKRLTVFDFDGTLTTKDSLWEFLKHSQKRRILICKLIYWMPCFVFYLFHIISAEKAKQKLFELMFKNWQFDDFESLCFSFIGKIEKIVNPEVITALKKHQSDGDTVLIISASVENWVRPWASQYGIKMVLGTQVAYDSNHRLTGMFASKNCNGQEKVNRLFDVFPDRSGYFLTVYGNSQGDAELLNIADHGIKIKRVSIKDYTLYENRSE